MKLTAIVGDDQAFYVKDGPKISSVQQLAEALEDNSISDDSFNYHVNNNNNDFVNWIQGVYRHENLAKSLKKVKAKKTFVNKIKEELKPAPAAKSAPAAKPAAKKTTKPAAKATDKSTTKLAAKPAAKKKK